MGHPTPPSWMVVGVRPPAVVVDDNRSPASWGCVLTEDGVWACVLAGDGVWFGGSGNTPMEGGSSPTHAEATIRSTDPKHVPVYVRYLRPSIADGPFPDERTLPTYPPGA